MMTSRTKLAARGSALAALTLGALGVFGPSLAHAHFVLQDPASYSVQDNYGTPQKSLPCGQADPGSTLMTTGMVTTYTQGQTINVTIKETIMHPGHYRVSIADKLENLPTDPPVVAGGGYDCGSTTISTNPTLPLVADGLLPHTTAFTTPQTAQVKLPANLTCTNCVMQIAEFMSDHGKNVPGGCFYHHCATINIVPANSTTDGGAVDLSAADLSAVPVDAATAPPSGSIPSGCSYYLGAAAAPAALYLASPFALALLLRRRRRATSA